MRRTGGLGGAGVEGALDQRRLTQHVTSHSLEADELAPIRGQMDGLHAALSDEVDMAGRLALEEHYLAGKEGFRFAQAAPHTQQRLRRRGTYVRAPRLG